MNKKMSIVSKSTAQQNDSKSTGHRNETSLIHIPSTKSNSIITPQKSLLNKFSHAMVSRNFEDELNISIISENPLNSNDESKSNLMTVDKSKRNPPSTRPRKITWGTFNSEITEQTYDKGDFYAEYINMNDKLKNTKFILFLCVSCLLGNLSTGYYWFLYNELFFRIQKPFGIIDEDASIINGSINAAFFGGGLIGSIISRYLSNVSHLTVFIVIDIIMIIGIAGSAVTSVYSLIAFRTIIGISAGVNFPMNNSYLKQISPSSLLAVLSNLGASFMLFGGVLDTVIFIPYATGLCSEDSGFWYVTLLIGAFIPITRIFLTSFYMVDTPTYHIKRKNYVAATEVLKKLYVRQNENISLTVETYEKVLKCIIHEEKKLLKMFGASTKKVSKKNH